MNKKTDAEPKLTERQRKAIPSIVPKKNSRLNTGVPVATFLLH